MRKIIIIEHADGLDLDAIADIWDKTQDAEAVRKSFIEQTGREPKRLTVVEPDKYAKHVHEKFGTTDINSIDPEELLRDWEEFKQGDAS